MIKIGIIGLNEGNGHPFSYSAIFNGYDPDELQKRCPFELIREYLPREHGNKKSLDSAKVTHIWTQDRQLSEDVAKVSLIPNIVDQYEDLIGKVDAVILARDDVENHLQMARPFLERKVPIFIDKQLVATKNELDEFARLTGPDYPLLAGSSSRFTRDLEKAKNNINLESVKTIHGVCPKSWMQYGHHLLEGVVDLYGYDINRVRSLSNKEGHDIVQIYYTSGLNVILENFNRAHLPIQFTAYSFEAEPYVIPYTDFFYSFREMLKKFVEMLETGKKHILYPEITSIAKVILAGYISKKNGGKVVSAKSLEIIDNNS